MSLHEAITTAMHRYVESRADCVSLMPSALAAATYSTFCDDTVEPHIAYGCMEHFKHMARKVLAGRFSDDGVDNAAYAEQGELFSGHLQERYPVPRKAGEEPQYKLRSDLSETERAWNVRQLRKSGSARLAHADALEAEGMSVAT